MMMNTLLAGELIMKNTLKKQQGFTLIELMIVVAIIGILAAIALPAYQNYTNKARFSEVVVATSAIKTAFEVAYADTPTFASAADDAGVAAAVSSANAQDGYVASVALNTTTGVILATSKNLSPAGTNFELTPVSSASGNINWTVSGSCVALGWCKD